MRVQIFFEMKHKCLEVNINFVCKLYPIYARKFLATKEDKHNQIKSNIKSSIILIFQ